MIGISGFLIWSKTLMELIFNPCDKFRCEVRRVQLAKSTLLTSTLVPLVPEFAVEDLPLSRTATLVPTLAMKDLSLGRAL